MPEKLKTKFIKLKTLKSGKGRAGSVHMSDYHCSFELIMFSFWALRFQSIGLILVICIWPHYDLFAYIQNIINVLMCSFIILIIKIYKHVFQIISMQNIFYLPASQPKCDYKSRNESILTALMKPWKTSSSANSSGVSFWVTSQDSWRFILSSILRRIVIYRKRTGISIGHKQMQRSLSSKLRMPLRI